MRWRGNSNRPQYEWQHRACYGYRRWPITMYFNGGNHNMSGATLNLTATTIGRNPGDPNILQPHQHRLSEHGRRRAYAQWSGLRPGFDPECLRRTFSQTTLVVNKINGSGGVGSTVNRGSNTSVRLTIMVSEELDQNPAFTRR